MCRKGILVFNTWGSERGPRSSKDFGGSIIGLEMDLWVAGDLGSFRGYADALVRSEGASRGPLVTPRVLRAVAWELW